MAACLPVLAGCVSLRFGKGFELDVTQLAAQSPAERTVKDLAEFLASEAPFPSDFEQRLSEGRKPGDFDPNRFFSVLSQIHMEPGYCLDYVYACSGGQGGYIFGGEPFLYAVVVEIHP
jgi:hypothetical protein